jgi:hypothetical protein
VVLVIVPVTPSPEEEALEAVWRPRPRAGHLPTNDWTLQKFDSYFDRVLFVLTWEYDLEILLLTRAESYWECRDHGL